MVPSCNGDVKDTMHLSEVDRVPFDSPPEVDDVFMRPSDEGQQNNTFEPCCFSTTRQFPL